MFDILLQWLVFTPILQVAITLISVNAPLIAQWLGDQSIPFLLDKYTDINVTGPRLDIKKEGPSGGACVALALSLLLGCSMVEEEVGITGTVDLRGRVITVGGVKEKIGHARKEKIPLMIVPWSALWDLRTTGWTEDEKDYLERSVRGAWNLVDVLAAAVQGKQTAECWVVEGLTRQVIVIGFLLVEATGSR